MPTRTRLVKVAPAQMDGQGSGGGQPGKLESQTLSQGNHESGWERQIAAVQSLLIKERARLCAWSYLEFLELFWGKPWRDSARLHTYGRYLAQLESLRGRSRDRRNTVSCVSLCQ